MSKLKPCVFNLKLTEEEGNQIREGAKSKDLSINNYLRVMLFHYNIIPEDEGVFEKSERKFKFKNKIDEKLEYSINKGNNCIFRNQETHPIQSKGDDFNKKLSVTNNQLKEQEVENLDLAQEPNNDVNYKSAPVTKDMNFTNTTPLELLRSYNITPPLSTKTINGKTVPWHESGSVLRKNDKGEDEITIISFSDYQLLLSNEEVPEYSRNFIKQSVLKLLPKNNLRVRDDNDNIHNVGDIFSYSYNKKGEEDYAENRLYTNIKFEDGNGWRIMSYNEIKDYIIKRRKEQEIIEDNRVEELTERDYY